MDTSPNKNKKKKNIINKTKPDGLYCNNCGKNGHIYKMCNDAVISIGILPLQLNIDDKIVDIIKGKLYGKNACNGIQFKDRADLDIFSLYRNNIKFLMIRRRHTLGFIEFMRGRYKIDNVDGIIFLFQQMTNAEISLIKSSSFDELWSELWFGEPKINVHDVEYKHAKDKFNKLKNSEEIDLNLQFYLENVVSSWLEAEWGFPKGRRNYHEDNMDCAIREFEEETNLAPDDYYILKNIPSIEEEFIGTNGVKYKHIYYVGLISDSKSINNGNTVFPAGEIGDMGLFTYEEAVKLIRPYHTERKKLLTMLYMTILGNIVEYTKSLQQQ